MMRFLFFLVLMCCVDLCACISADLQSSKKAIKNVFDLKEKPDLDWAKTPHTVNPDFD